VIHLLRYAWLIPAFGVGGFMAYRFPQLVRVLVLLAIAVIPWLSWDYRNRRVKKRQHCVACGNIVKVEMLWNAMEKQIVCKCPECSALWGYNPVVRAESWSRAEEAR